MAIVPNNTDNIDVGRPAKVGGYAFWAPVGTPLPANATADLDEKFVNLGYVSKDGLSWAPERNTTDHQDWGGDTVETTQESYGETWTITFIESLRGDLLKILFGPENVTIEEPTAAKEGSIEIRGNSVELPDGVFAFLMKSRKSTRRPILPNARVTAIGEVKFTPNDLISYQATIKTKPDTAGQHYYQKIGIPKRSA